MPRLPAVALKEHPAFAVLGQDLDHQPHVFAAFRYAPPPGDSSWTRLTQSCLAAWRLTAAAYVDRVDETGFRSGDLVRRLNAAGAARLPVTPAEDGDVTKDRHVTDLTEILALVALDELVGPVTFPYPGVLHHDSRNAQHRGIDLLGYVEDGDEYALVISEVMASTERRHPPSTVRDHHKQILAETLDETGLGRLIFSLSAVHDEAPEPQQRILNAFLVAALDGSLESAGAVIASPILVRRNGEYSEADWRPFLSKLDSYESAKVPSTVVFLAIEPCDTFSGWLDSAKTTLQAVQVGPGERADAETP